MLQMTYKNNNYEHMKLGGTNIVYLKLFKEHLFSKYLTTH